MNRGNVWDAADVIMLATIAWSGALCIAMFKVITASWQTL